MLPCWQTFFGGWGLKGNFLGGYFTPGEFSMGREFSEGWTFQVKFHMWGIIQNSYIRLTNSLFVLPTLWQLSFKCLRVLGNLRKISNGFRIVSGILPLGRRFYAGEFLHGRIFRGETFNWGMNTCGEISTEGRIFGMV